MDGSSVRPCSEGQGTMKLNKVLVAVRWGRVDASDFEAELMPQEVHTQGLRLRAKCSNCTPLAWGSNICLGNMVCACNLQDTLTDVLNSLTVPHSVHHSPSQRHNPQQAHYRTRPHPRAAFSETFSICVRPHPQQSAVTECWITPRPCLGVLNTAAAVSHDHQTNPISIRFGCSATVLNGASIRHPTIFIICLLTSNCLVPPPCPSCLQRLCVVTVPSCRPAQAAQMLAAHHPTHDHVPITMDRPAAPTPSSRKLPSSEFASAVPLPSTTSWALSTSKQRVPSLTSRRLTENLAYSPTPTKMATRVLMRLSKWSRGLFRS